MTRHDEAYLLDMLLAARQALKFVEDVSRDQFTKSPLIQNAVVRLLGVIGEAASRIAESTRDAHPELPWREVIGMRMLLADVKRLFCAVRFWARHTYQR